jgi:three-Cys-motif partner protein
MLLELVGCTSKRVQELERLKTEFPHHHDKIFIRQNDASEYLQKITARRWDKDRALLFLDPFGASVDWNIVQGIAKTEAMDVWYLFSIRGVQSYLRNDGVITEAAWAKLSRLFGNEEWYQEFYIPNPQLSLFGEQEPKKIVTSEAIATYYAKRLKTIFAGVLDEPLLLRNSKNAVIFALCFAAGNPKGAPTALKIAKDLLQSNL